MGRNLTSHKIYAKLGIIVTDGRMGGRVEMV